MDDPKKRYAGKILPELYLIATQRGIEHFFPKDVDEMIEVLLKWDEDHPTQQDEGKPMPKQSPAEIDDDILDVDELDETEDAAPAPKKGKAPPAPKKSGRSDVDTPEQDEENLDDILEDADDAEPVVTPPKKKEKAKAAPEPEEESVNLEDDLDDILEDADETEPATPAKGKKTMARPKKTEETPAPEKAKKAPAPEKAKKAPAPKKEEVKNGTEGMSPYQASSAGHMCYIALKRGGSMEKVVETADKLIAKFKIKPPSNTAAKVKVIYTEINAGKKDKKWGKFEKDEK